jgi:hypothetical protein
MRTVMLNRAPEPTWQEKMDREIEDAQTRLQKRLHEEDRTLEVLTAKGPGPQARCIAFGNPLTRF